MKNLFRPKLFIVVLSLFSALGLLACSSVGVGISVPIGPFGSVGVGTSTSGGVSVGAGVGVGGASVGVSGTIPTAPTKKEENLPAPATPAASSPTVPQ